MEPSQMIARRSAILKKMLSRIWVDCFQIRNIYYQNINIFSNWRKLKRDKPAKHRTTTKRDKLFFSLFSHYVIVLHLIRIYKPNIFVVTPVTYWYIHYYSNCLFKGLPIIRFIFQHIFNKSNKFRFCRTKEDIKRWCWACHCRWWWIH